MEYIKSYQINDELVFLLTTKHEGAIKGIITFSEHSEEQEHLYEIHMCWQGIVHIHMLRESEGNLDAEKNYVYMGEMDEMMDIIQTLKKLKDTLFD